MQLTFDRQEKIVGFFVLSIIILLFAAIVIVGRGKNWFKKNITYYTTFNESYNLQEQAAVKLYNTDIGKVTDVSLVKDKVRVKLKILEDYASRIREDTVVTVESPTLIGSEYISVTPGSKNSERIEPNGEIKSVPKKSISDMVAEFQLEKTAKLISKTVENIYILTNVLKNPKGPLIGVINNTNKSVANIEKIISGIEKGEGTLGSLIRSKKLIESVHSKLDDLGSIIKNVDNATPATLRKLNTNLKQIERILKNIEKGSYDVPQITKKTKVAIENIDDGVKDIDKVVESVQKNPLIRSNLPKEPKGKSTDSRLRD